MSDLSVIPTPPAPPAAPDDAEKFPRVDEQSDGTTVVTCSTGLTARFADWRRFKAGDRKNVLRGLSETDNKFVAGIDTVDAVLVLLISEWSSDLPLPRFAPSSLDEIEMDEYDELVEAADPAIRRLFPNMAKNEQTAADPNSPTAPSNG